MPAGPQQPHLQVLSAESCEGRRHPTLQTTDGGTVVMAPTQGPTGEAPNCTLNPSEPMQLGAHVSGLPHHPTLRPAGRV